MRAMIVKAANEPLVLEERETPSPGFGEVRITVQACGVCHSDLFVTKGLWPGLEYPRAPGHEVAGVVDAIGDGVQGFEVGDRVGLGWHGGHDGTCDACLTGRFVHCTNQRITGISYDGGYQESVVAPATALARIPDGLRFEHAAPILCAGVTTFNALRNTGARPGDLVGIQGLGGLGHLGVQYAHAMGFEVAAISRGAEKRDFAAKLGAHHYLDAKAEDVAARLQTLGGARVILATAPHAASISALVPGLGLEGQLVIVAVPSDSIEVSALDLIMGDRRVEGWASGTAIDSTEALQFTKLHGIEPMIETFALEQANEALARMESGKVRFRSVIKLRD